MKKRTRNTTLSTIILFVLQFVFFIYGAYDLGFFLIAEGAMLCFLYALLYSIIIFDVAVPIAEKGRGRIS